MARLPMTQEPSSWWVVTDLDGTLLDHHYDWSPAAEAIRWLQERRIPVIPCTSKTAEEVRRFRQDAGLSDPFIVENGGAIHGQHPDGEEWEISLGPGWQELRPKLKEIEAKLGEPLLALDELSDAEGDRLLGLSGEALRMAQRRRCSVPFVAPARSSRDRLIAMVQEYRLTIVEGNRMAHLLGDGISKGRALEALKQQQACGDVQVLGLGDSPNDLPLLEVADIAVVVPGMKGPHPKLIEGIEAGRFQLARAPHGHGWAESVLRLLPG
jgi:mannosyl-3-phosphoglycerate phosphatase